MGVGLSIRFPLPNFCSWNRPWWIRHCWRVLKIVHRLVLGGSYARDGDWMMELIGLTGSELLLFLFSNFLLNLIYFLCYIMLLLPTKECFRAGLTTCFDFGILFLIWFGSAIAHPSLLLHSYLFRISWLGFRCLMLVARLYCAFWFGTLLQNFPFPVYVAWLFYGDTFGTSINGGRFETS